MAGRSVTVSLRGNVAQYNASMMSAAAATEAAMGRASAATSRHQALWRATSTAIKYGAVGAAGGIAVAIKASADFEARMANVRTLSKATGAEMRALRESALTAGTGFGYTANEVADAQTEMIKAGVSLKNIMGGGLRGTLALAAAGQIDVADATTIAASAMTQFGLRGRDLPHVADLLAAGADKALGSVQDLGYGMSQVGTQAHQMGLSVDDTVGTLAEFAQAGLIGERGGTAFKQMLLRLSSPSKEASKLMSQYGLSLYDANGQMKTMPEIAGNLTRSFKDLAPAQRNAALGTIFGSHAIQAANILIAGGEKGNRRWIKSVNDQGFAAQQAGGKLDSLKGDFQKLKAVGENALIELGSGLQSPLRGLVQNVTSDIAKITRNGDLKRWSADIGHDLQSIITAAGPLAHSVGGALETVGRGIGQVVDGYNKLPKGLQSALVTGGAVAYGAHKFGLDSLASTLVRGGTGKGVGGLGGMAKGVTPVVVTNWPASFGPGVPGSGPGGTPPIVPMSKGARLAGALDRGARSPLTFGALEVGSLAVHNIAPQRAFASGALAGAGVGGFIGGAPGAAAGALIGGSASYLHSLQKNKPTKFDADMAAPTSQSEKLAKSYAELYKAQEKIRKADPKGFQDALKVPSEASQNADLLGRTLQKMGEVTGHTVSSQQALRMAMVATGTAAGNASQKVSTINFGDLAFNANKAGISTQQLAQDMGTLPDQVQTQIMTPGALTSRAQIVALGKQYGLTPRQVQTIITIVGARDAKGWTKGVRDDLRKLPKAVQTIVGTPGALKSRAQVTALAAAFHLTPKQIQILMEILGANKAKKAIDDTKKGARELNQTSAKPKVFADTAPAQAKITGVTKGMRVLNQTSAKPKVFAQDNASGTISHIKGEINSIPPSRTSTITVNHVTTYSTRGHPSAAAAARNPSLNKPAPPSANGSLYVGRVRAFADGGGYDDQGNYVPRVPQMRQGGGNVLWSEPVTGWEAYISGKPGMRERNLQILSQAGDRLGADVVRRFANGGTIDRDALVRALRISASSAYVDDPAEARRVAAQIAAGKALTSVSGRLADYSRQMTQALRAEGPAGKHEPMFQQIRRFRDEFAAVVKLTRRPPSATVILHRATTAVTAAQRELNHADDNRKKRENETKKAYQAHLKAVRGVASELTKVDDKLKAQRDARKEYAGTVSSAYVQDPFGGSLAGFNAQLGYESRNIRGAKADLATAKAHGLSGALYQGLAASGNTGLIDQFAHLSRAQIAREEQLYSTRNRLDKQLGTQAANAVFNTRIAHLTTQVRGLTAELHKVRTGKTLGKTEVHLHGSKARDTEQLAKKTAKQLEQALLVAKHG